MTMRRQVLALWLAMLALLLPLAVQAQRGTVFLVGD